MNSNVYDCAVTNCRFMKLFVSFVQCLLYDFNFNFNIFDLYPLKDRPELHPKFWRLVSHITRIVQSACVVH